LYEPSSTKYAIYTIKFDNSERDPIDFTDIVSFTEYIENDVVHRLPYDWVGLIPNYKYIVGNLQQFKIDHENSHVTETYSSYKGRHFRDEYHVKVKIPFVMDELNQV